jgi:hypothetical protein
MKATRLGHLAIVAVGIIAALGFAASGVRSIGEASAWEIWTLNPQQTQSDEIPDDGGECEGEECEEGVDFPFDVYFHDWVDENIQSPVGVFWTDEHKITKLNEAAAEASDIVRGLDGEQDHSSIVSLSHHLNHTAEEEYIEQGIPQTLNQWVVIVSRFLDSIEETSGERATVFVLFQVWPAGSGGSTYEQEVTKHVFLPVSYTGNVLAHEMGHVSGLDHHEGEGMSDYVMFRWSDEGGALNHLFEYEARKYEERALELTGDGGPIVN